MNYYAPFYRPTYYGNSPDTSPFGAYPQPSHGMPYQQAQSQQAASNDMIWVQGEAGAKAYLVAPNATVTLWDSETPTIYIKTADASGVPNMRVFTYTERVTSAPKTPENHVCACGGKYAKVEDFNALQARFEALSSKLDELAKNGTKVTPKLLTEDDNNG